MAMLAGRALLGLYDTPQDTTVPLPDLDAAEWTTILPTFGQLAVPASIQDTRGDAAQTQEIPAVGVSAAPREVRRARRALYTSQRPSEGLLEQVLEGLRRLGRQPDE